MTISDQIILATEEMVGKDHATKSDTLNRGFLVDHKVSGAHEALSGEFTNDEGATLAANVLVKVNSAERSYQKTVAGDEGKFGYYGVTASSTPNASKDRIITGHYVVVDWDGVGTPTIGTSTVTPSGTAGKVKLASTGDFEIGLVVKTAGLTNQLGVWLFGWRGNIEAGVSLTQTFRGLHLRTHPDNDLDDRKVMLVHADEIVMDGGARVADWDRLEADITVAGAGGLDAGAEAASVWYEIYAIRKSIDGTKNLLLHRAKDYFKDEEYITGEDGSFSIRGDAVQQKLSQGFKVDTTGPCPFIDLKLLEVGAVAAANMWATIENDDGTGKPKATPDILATSDKIATDKIRGTTATPQWIRFIFRNPPTLTAGTQYHIVLQADYAINATNRIDWAADTTAGTYANGQRARFDGTNWIAEPDDDMIFKLYITRNEAAVAMPAGYDQKAIVGYVFNNSSSDFDLLSFVGHRAKPLVNTKIGSISTANLATLFDISAIIPPVPVFIEGGGANSIDNALVVLSSVPNGFESLYADGGAGVARHSGTGTGQPEASMGLIPTDYQGIYAVVNTGTGHFWVTGWEW